MRADYASSLKGYSSPEMSLGAFGSLVMTDFYVDMANLSTRLKNILIYVL